MNELVASARELTAGLPILTIVTFLPAAGAVLILAATTGYQTRMFAHAAGQLGIELIYATDRCDQLDDPWRDGAIPVRFHEEWRSVDALLKALDTRPIDGILAVGDRPTVMAAQLARLLNLPGHPPEAAVAARDKRIAREKFRAGGLLVANSFAVPMGADPLSVLPRVDFPAVLKPTVLSGSRGVIRVDDAVSFATAFGRVRKLLESKGCRFVDTTCGDVMSVWKRVRQYSRDKVTSIIHGKAWHEETKATSSQATATSGHYLVVFTLAETDYVCDYILQGGNKEEFLAKFKGAYSAGFDPDIHLRAIGVANQTTMLRGETEEVQRRLKNAMVQKYGAENINEHFRFFDTICGATQDRQDALQKLLKEPMNLLLVIGGYNSSNTSHLAEMGDALLPTYFIKNAAKMQELAPEIKKIKEKYAGDAEKQMRAQQELYKKHNFNMFGGCLPVFIQLPIFIGLYRCLSIDIALRDASLIPGFWWASNLAGPDKLFYWKDWMPAMLGSETGYLGPYFNILPVITCVLFILQQQLFMPPATDEQTQMQQSMMKYMTIFMGIMFFKVPAGLCIYFIVSTTWSIVERTFLPKHKPTEGGSPPEAKAAAAGPSPNGSPTDKRGPKVKKK